MMPLLLVSIGVPAIWAAFAAGVLSTKHDSGWYAIPVLLTIFTVIMTLCFAYLPK